MTTEERIRLVLELQGKGELGRAAAEAKTLAKELQGVGEAAENAAGKGGNTKGMANLTRAVSLFGQDAAQGFALGKDAMQGFSNAVTATGNNLDALLTALGVTGLAGMLATIGYTLAPLALRALQALFNDEPVKTYSSRVDALKAQIEELEKKPVKLTVDFEDIERARKEVEALNRAKQVLDALLGSQSKLEKESGAAVNAAIVETPGGLDAFQAAQAAARARRLGAVDIQDLRGAEARANATLQTHLRRLSEARARRGLAILPTEEENRVGREATLAQDEFDQARKAREAAENAAREEVDRKFGAMLGTATTGRGPAQVAAQRQLAEALTGQGGAGARAAARIDVARPEVLAAAEQAKKQAEAIERREKATEQATKAMEGFAQAQAGAVKGQADAARVAAQAGEAMGADAAGIGRPALSRAARERAEAEARTREAARDLLGRDPTLGLETQEFLRQRGNTRDAQGAARRRLQQTMGLSGDVAGTIVQGQSAELQTAFDQALSVSGDRAAADQAVKAGLVHRYRQMADQMQRLIQNDRILLEQMRDGDRTLQNSGRQ